MPAKPVRVRAKSRVLPELLGDEKTFRIGNPNPALPGGAHVSYFLRVHDQNRNHERCFIYRELWWAFKPLLLRSPKGVRDSHPGSAGALAGPSPLNATYVGPSLLIEAGMWEISLDCIL